MTFHATNNFEGPIPQVIGKFKEFRGPNAFTRSIPSFIGNLQQLESLDLSSNNLRTSEPNPNEHPTSIISDTFPEGCWLQTLSLNQNRLEGKVPKSLGNCKCLEVLDIGNNQINDSFPCHLKNIAKLHVLVLRSNKFNGHIDCPRNNNGWPMLQIFDLASNNFSDAIPATIKGNKLELVKIPVNNFEGPIPEVIGKFEALDALNFSHNAFTGSIPTTFGNLRELGSYSNNTGLCGPPLKTMCGLPPAKEDSPSDSETGSIIH
ncbi:hypothetical protein Gogos_000031 [Gossypium gossypioides]|uniref:Leucine-rich repeat-containing N-terminal plant-type domain-containing protein n=1 Tax=Gossypium gossypioides TaxID=34282 RepID=A0A7J9D623_GOSGO|nr:hypothetical protein [Gossypium gossypioides]